MVGMAETRHLSVSIQRPVEAVYDFVVNPANLTRWAPGLGDSVEQVDGAWFVTMTIGRARLVFAERNPFGVLDHQVTLATGETFYNPMRVVPDGAGSELVFSVRRRPSLSDEDFDRDAAAVLADLQTVKAILEDPATERS